MKKNRLILFGGLFFLVLIIGVVIRSWTTAAYKYSVKEMNTMAFSGMDALSLMAFQQVVNEKDDYIIIDISEEGILHAAHPDISVHIPFSLLLEKESQKKLRAESKKQYLFSDTEHLSAAAWLLLYQNGIDNIQLIAGNPQSFLALLSGKYSYLEASLHDEKQRYNYGRFIR